MIELRIVRIECFILFFFQMVSALTSIKPVNKTDAMTLMQNYGTLANMINSSEEKLAQCPGFGARKAKKLHKTLNESFLKK